MKICNNWGHLHKKLMLLKKSKELGSFWNILIFLGEIHCFSNLTVHCCYENKINNKGSDKMMPIPNSVWGMVGVGR